MSSNDLKLRGRGPRRTGPYPLGQLPDRVLYDIAKQLVHRIAVGHGDITGDDFGTIFANAIGAEHRRKPLGIADVVWNAWVDIVHPSGSTTPITSGTHRRRHVAINRALQSLRRDIAMYQDAIAQLEALR